MLAHIGIYPLSFKNNLMRCKRCSLIRIWRNLIKKRTMLRKFNIILKMFLLVITIFKHFSWIRILNRTGSGLRKKIPIRIRTKGPGSETLHLGQVNSGRQPLTAQDGLHVRHTQTRLNTVQSDTQVTSLKMGKTVWISEQQSWARNNFIALWQWERDNVFGLPWHAKNRKKFSPRSQ